MNTFMNILGVIFSVMSGFTVVQTVKRKKQLGEVKSYTLGGLKYTDKSQTVLILLCLALWMYSLIEDQAYVLGNMFTYIFLAAMFMLLIANLIQITIKPGFYETGLATGSSTLFYSEVKSYEVIANKKNPDILYIYFNGGAKLFSSVRVVIDKDKLPEIKKFLKKECTFR